MHTLLNTILMLIKDKSILRKKKIIKSDIDKQMLLLCQYKLKGLQVLMNPKTYWLSGADKISKA